MSAASRYVGETLLILLNAPLGADLVHTADDPRPEAVWDRILDTADTSEEPRQFEGGRQYPAQDRSFVVLAVRSRQLVGHTATPSQVRAVMEEIGPGGFPHRPMMR